MIARARQLADEQCPLPAADGDGPDETVVGNVVRAGGRADTFVRSWAAGRRAVRADVDELDLVAVAAWRAGALALRADALDRLEAARAAPAPWSWASAALGIGSDMMGEFLRRHRAGDRWWWPGRDDDAGGWVAAVGGFTGLGGVWIEPPEVWRPAGPGAFVVRAADEWWRIDADVWGARLGRMAPTSFVGDPDPVATLVVAPTTHLAWIRATTS